MSAIQEKTAIDRVKLPFTFDVEKMVAEYRAMECRNFIYYDVIQLRGPAHMIDPNLPVPPPADDFADGSWTDWMDSRALLESPYYMSIVDFFRAHTTVNLVRLLRLEAGAVVKEHTDPTLGLQIEKSVIRLTVPVLSPPEVEFYLNNSLVPMQPGECWYMRLTDPHRIVNQSDAERVNFTIDMIPNDWVRETILAAM